MEIRRSAERGLAEHGWLKSFHTFSFADYYDPKYMGFGPLRVINEDRVQPGQGFGTHGHRDMEILSVVLDGALAHRDNMGNGATIVPGEVQRMSAGRGVAPSYEEKHFEEADKRGKLRLIASPDGAQGSVRLHQDAKLYAALLDGEETAALEPAPGRLVYVHVARGSVSVNGTPLEAGDAVKLAGNDNKVRLDNGRGAEVLVFDLNR